MSDQRSAFRFRVPRLRPSVPPPRSATATSQTRLRRPPVQSQPQPQPQPSPPPLPLPVPPRPPQDPPVIPPIRPIQPLDTVHAPALEPTVQQIQDGPPPPSPTLAAKDQESIKTESGQPSTESQTGIQSRVSSHPESPSRMSTEPRVSAKPASPTTRSPPTSPTVSPHESPSRLASTTVKKIPSLPSSPTATNTKTVPEEELPVPHTTISNSSKPQTEQGAYEHVHEVQPHKGPQILKDPPETETEDTLEVKRSTETNQSIDSNTNQEKHEETFMERSSVEEAHVKEKPIIETQKPEGQNHEKQEEDINTTTNTLDTPETKSMVSDKIRISEPLQDPKHIDGPRPEEMTCQKPASVITFSGHNKGTSMRIGSGGKKREKTIHIYRRYKANPDESSDTMTDGEEESNEKKSENDLKENAYVNCNIQGINNSMVFNCCFTEKSPGVYLGSSFNPKNVKKPKMKNTNSTDTKRVKVKITPSHKVTYEPIIRRRCLGGLFMESSDSDPDDPEKPRRHGCRYAGGEKSNKGDKMDG